MTIKLTATQTTVIKTAAARPDGNIEPLPVNLRGGARTAVIDGLLARDLITKFLCQDRVEYNLTDAAYAAVGCKRKVPAPVMPDPEIDAAVSAAEAKWRADGVAKHDTIRSGTKLAEIVDAMKRPGGATVAQMMAGTGWQAHSVRGAISGMVKKKLGYEVVTENGADGLRAYRIV